MKSTSKKMSVKVLLVMAATLAAAPAALAADMPVKAHPMAPATYDWSGFYVGGSIGARWSNSEWRTVNTTGAALAIVGPNNPASLKGTSFRASAYAGYNWMIAPAWLVGLEAEIATANNSDSVSPFPGTPGGVLAAGPTNSDTVKLGWDASLRARLGVLVSPAWLIYGTGGVAWQKISTTSDCGAPAGFCGPGGNVAGLSSTVKVGWTLGGGTELALSRHWLARAEYRYSDFGHVSNDLPPAPGVGLHSEIRVKTHTALVGIAYKF